MSIQDIIQSKKEWRIHIGRVKKLPKDYQIVYKEIQKYIFKVGLVEFSESTDLLSGIVDFFEESAELGKGVLEVTGNDVATFCDGLIKDSKTYEETYQEIVDEKINKAIKGAINETKR